MIMVPATTMVIVAMPPRVVLVVSPASWIIVVVTVAIAIALFGIVRTRC